MTQTNLHVDEPLWFNAVLYPHRSLGRRGFIAVMLIFGIIAFGVSMIFYAIGAWPVIGFMGLDVLAIYIAFRVNFRAARQFETVQLAAHELRISRTDPRGRSRSWSFQPNWLRISPQPDLSLSTHGRKFIFGQFLNTEEKVTFASSLNNALSRWRKGAPPV